MVDCGLFGGLCCVLDCDLCGGPNKDVVVLFLVVDCGLPGGLCCALDCGLSGGPNRDVDCKNSDTVVAEKTRTKTSKKHNFKHSFVRTAKT